MAFESGDGIPFAGSEAAFTGIVTPSDEPLACNSAPGTNDLTDQIALVRRGGCNFIEKFTNVANRNAKSIIVYNDGTAPDRFGLVQMGGLSASTIPGIFISFADGTALFDAIQDGTVQISAIGAGQKFISDFSSRGPYDISGIEFFGLKPDIAAPGKFYFSEHRMELVHI